MTTDTPLIYTSRGNLPLAELTLETQWEFGERYVKFIERYRAGDGDVVRESAHVYSFDGVAGEGIASPIG